MAHEILMFETSLHGEDKNLDTAFRAEAGDRMAPWQIKIRKIPTDVLCENLGGFIKELGQVLHKIPELAQPWSLDSLEISATVSAEGQIGLLGTGGKIAGGSEIRLIFKKNALKETDSTQRNRENG